MAITDCYPTSFKTELFSAIHDFTVDTFKIALYTSSATLNAATTAYTSSGEVVGTGYSATGIALTTVALSTDGTTVTVDFDDPSWAGATFTARGALIYNSSKANRAVRVIDFGADKTKTAATFTIKIPVADKDNAIIRA